MAEDLKLISEITPSPSTFPSFKSANENAKIGKLCPVCKGRGFVSSQFYKPINNDGYTTDIKDFPVTCRGCGGRGVI